MSLGEECFHAVCDAPDAAEAIRSLSGPQLAALIGHLGRDFDENSLTGELMGLCLVESVRRLTNPLEAGTTNENES